MDKERRMINLPLYYVTTWCYISIWRTFTWLNVDIIHEEDRFWSLRLSVGRWHRHVFGGWRNGADGGSATSGLRPGLRILEVGGRCVDFMSWCDLSHWNIIWKIWNKYTVLYMKGKRKKRKTLCFLEHLWRINGFSFEVRFFGGFMDRVRHQSWDVVMLGMEWSTGADEAMLQVTFVELMLFAFPLYLWVSWISG